MDSFRVLLLDKLNCNDLASLKIVSNHFSPQYIALFEIARQTYLKRQGKVLFLHEPNHLMLALFLRLACRNPSDEYIIYLYNPSLTAINWLSLLEKYVSLISMLPLFLYAYYYISLR